MKILRYMGFFAMTVASNLATLYSPWPLKISASLMCLGIYWRVEGCIP